ncbi:helix-turn-helix domain-containing protein [Dactylosporangium sp. NPDC048998]|uniref:helix-turn-helix domain-containing protein n=1 Tax=Dactylosporangium sp. NPDC048998 TaxID=3363976 RepID=UPI003719BB05
MSAARLSTSDLPVEHRFEAWSEMAIKAHVPVALDTSQRDDFLASIDVIDLGPMTLTRTSHPPIQARRTTTMIRSNDPEIMMLTYVNRGLMTVDSNGRVAALGPGFLTVVDTSRPTMTLNNVDSSDITLQFPRSLLGLRRSQLDALLAVPVAAAEGIGGLIAYILLDLCRNAGNYDAPLVARLTTTVTDLLAGLVRTASGSRRPVPPSGRDRIRHMRIYAYIERHLTDPALTPNAIAEAHGLSVRQLDRIFQVDGASPSGWIRRQRLDRCRADLVDPAQSWQAIADVGARWGFPDPAGFNRAFRREYAMPPGEYRRLFTGSAAERGHDVDP